PPTPPRPRPGRRRPYRSPPSRKNLHPLMSWQTKEAHAQIKRLATELGVSQQIAIGEALNQLFARYGRPPVAIGLTEPAAPQT
ncbi:MAG TPA: ribbon-helix-helix domain-containing protein, partial [Hyphomicrobiaceae bacterium]